MKNSYYFDHDYNARNDQKILELRAEFGWQGYGIYFAIIEVLCESNGIIKRGALGGLSLGFSMPKSEVEKLIDFMIGIELLNESDGNIFSKRINEHLAFRTRLSEAGKRGGRGNKKPPFSPPKAPLEAGKESKGKESKVKESKEKESKGEDIPHQPFSQIPVKPTDFTYQQTIDEFLISQAWMEGLAMAFKKDYEFIKTDSLDFLKNLNDKGQFPRDIFDTKRFYYNSLQKKMMETKTRSKREGTLV